MVLLGQRARPRDEHLLGSPVANAAALVLGAVAEIEEDVFGSARFLANTGAMAARRSTERDLPRALASED